MNDDTNSEPPCGDMAAAGRRRRGDKLAALLPTEAAPSATPVKAKGGRPRNEDDVWAWKQVNEQERPAAEVKQEWLARIGDRAQTLADYNESFRKAIAQRKKRKKRKKPE